MYEPDRESAEQASTLSGSAWVFLLPLLAAVAWLLTEPAADLSNPWALLTDAAIHIGGLLVLFLLLFWLQGEG
jgi:low affinity Fe/Cu permease